MASTRNIQNGTLSLSSSCSEYQWEVFLSFGGDTRNTFTDHLFRTLYFDRGINTFRDSEGLDRGKPISPELLKAIEKSRIAVVILSENYVSSTWCLEELLKILECMDAERMTVLPIFYHVDPSHVRHLKGTIADAFAKHVLSIFKEDIQKKVHRWIDALRRVASLSGHHLKDHEPESEFMRRFVEEITSELNCTIDSVYKDKYVGIDSPVQEILDLHIDMASKDDVRFIGICGVSGIGKTTLAEIVFEKIHRQFEASSFLRDVKRHDLGDSQEQLLRDMKLKIEIPRWDVLRGIKVTSLRLRNKKVIIVLDDVEEEKLEKLARSRDWFGPGSRIIITTEDKGLLLRKCEKENIYNAKKLDASDALELFSQEAFGKPHCEKDLLDICNDFVSCVDGHPLALKILGSSMHSITNIDIWKAKLESLRESAKLPNDRIQTVLRMKRKGGNKVKFSFDSPDVSLALECGVNLGYQRNVGDYRCILLNLVNSCFDLHLINGTGSSYEEDPCPQRSPISLEETSARTPQYSYEDPHPHNQFSKTDFDPLAYYNNCFPPSKVTQEWFSQQSRGHSVTIDIPPNLCDDNNWMGLSLHACFSMHGDQHTILDNCVSEIPHFLYCQVGTRVAGLDDKILACRTSGAEITWLINQGEFSWISYAPGEKLKNMLRHCSQIEGSFVSDWPGVTVQACALRLFYLHDQLKSGQNKKQCNDLISEHSDSVHQFRADEEKRNGQNLDDEAGPPTTSSSNGDYLKRRPTYQGKTNEDFDRCLIYNSCFPQSEILDWFSHQSDGPKVTIPLPPNLYNNSTWTGLALFASFSVLEHSTTLVGSQDSQVHCRLGFLSQNSNFCLESLRSYCLTEEDLSLLKLGGFMWLSYIPRGQFPKWLNRCSSIEASISYCPGFTVQKYGLHLLYQNDEEEFKETISRCKASFSNSYENTSSSSNDQDSHPERPGSNEDFHDETSGRPINQGESDGANNQLCNNDPLPINQRHGEDFRCAFISQRPMPKLLPSIENVEEERDCTSSETFPNQEIAAGTSRKCSRLWPWEDVLEVLKNITGTYSVKGIPFVKRQRGSTRSISMLKPWFKRFLQETLGSPEDPCRRRKFIEHFMNPSPSHVDEPEPNQSSGQSDSNPRLKRQLKSLLSLLYQGDPARYHRYDYIFPQIKIAAPPRWFKYQNVSSVIKMELPSNFNDNTKWMGFTVYALFIVPKQSAFSGDNQDSLVFVKFSSVAAGDPVAPGIVFSLSRDTFVGSHRLLIFYMPRELLKLNGCSNIWASFKSNNPSMEVGMCGIRPVYEQDVEEFVETLVECMLGCPDAYHDSICANLLENVAMLQECRHGEDFRCSFTSQRPMPKLLPSIETIEEEEDCTSPKTFPNQEIEARTSRNSIPTFTLGIPFVKGQSGTAETIRMLQTWFKRYVQDHYNLRGIFNHCFPESEIPQWFRNQNNGSSVTIGIPQNLFNDRNWMGFAMCAVFPFHKHETAVRNNLDSGINPHRVICQLQTDIGGMSPLSLSYGISEDEVLISLYKRAFLWVSFTPSGNWVGKHVWNQMSWAKFSFLSDTPDVSSAVKCGVNLVYRHNLDEFTRTIVQLLTLYVDYLHRVRKSCKKRERPTVYQKLPFYHGEEEVRSSYKEDPRPQRVPVQAIQPEHSSIGGLGTPKQLYQTGPLDFNPLLLYNNCFPPKKVTQEWFTHRSGGRSVTIEIPPNLFNDNNWMGLALCVCFSLHGDDPNTIVDHMLSEIPHYLYCQFRRTAAGRDEELTFACGTSKAEITWLLNIGGFIWISYIPGEPFKNMLRQCSRIEGSFVSDWPGVIVQESALRLLYQHDQVQFEQKLEECNASIFEHSDLGKRNKRQNPDDEARSTMVPYRSIDDFHRHLFYNSCFPQSEILDWFGHRRKGPKVKIPLPPNFYNDTTWTGLALFASFSVLVGSPNSQVHCRFVFASENGTFALQRLHSYCLLEDDLCLLNLNGFMWLAYIPRGWFPKWMNRCSSIEAEIIDCPGLTVQKCGLHLLYQKDEEFFKEILFKTHLYNKYENEANKFDGCLVYDSCLPSNEILEWFSHRSDGPQVTISLPPNLYDDPTWMGLALCVSWNLDSQAPCNQLICLLETATGNLEPLHIYCLTKEDLALLRLGGFIWLSYIPRGSFPNWVNQSSFIEASIVTDCLFNNCLTVHKCGFRLLFQNEETEFKETIRHYTASHCTASLTIANEKTEDKAAEPSTTSSSDDPRPKDKGKRIGEE